MKKPDEELKAAYALETPEDNKRLYATWAESYETTFAEAMDYRLPERVADAAKAFAVRGPMLDIGAGTGLLGQALVERGLGPVDGTDISPEMLGEAGLKGCYRHLFAADINEGLPIENRTYQAIISAGTFTTGHVGPDALDEVMRVTSPGGRLVLSINAEHWNAAGFSEKFEALSAQISSLEILTLPIYGASASGDHAQDAAQVVLAIKA
ncbi:class I SAM-dependent methyltransferase [Rhodobacteraceae bacterium 63075]|nr:class I SAM-dependent methyltransferase [Rhodobacteraceae bacterium 63075]